MFNPHALAPSYVEIYEASADALRQRTGGASQPVGLAFAQEGRYAIWILQDLDAYTATAVIAHEVAHLRYRSFEALPNVLLYQQRWGNYAHVFKFLWDILEDARVEYHLMKEFPYALPYIATLRQMLVMVMKVRMEEREITTRTGYLYDLCNQTAIFVRSGEYPDEMRPLVNFLAPRLTCLAREDDPFTTAQIASQYLAYALLLRQRQGKSTRKPTEGSLVEFAVDPKKAKQLREEAYRKERRREIVKSRPEGGSKGQGGTKPLPSPGKPHHGQARPLPGDRQKGVKLRKEGQTGSGQGRAQGRAQTVTPWGATSGQFRVTMQQAVRQGLSYSDALKIRYGGVIGSDHFANEVIRERVEDIRAIREATKSLTTKTRVYTDEGMIALDRQSEAYMNSFLGPDDQGKVFMRNKQRPFACDVAMLLDISGSMQSGTPASMTLAMSDLVTLVKGFEGEKVRLMICGVATHMTVLKGFDDPLNPALLYPQGEGSTNFHTALKQLPALLDWKHPRRFLFIISDAAWPWNEVQRLVNPAYHNVKIAPIFINAAFKHLMAAKQVFDKTYTSIFQAVEETVGVPVIRKGAA